MSLPASLQAAGLFEEQDKDAEAGLVLEVEKDRAVTEDENRKFVQSSRAYLSGKVRKLEEEMALLTDRMESLESAVKALLQEERNKSQESKQ